MRLITTLYTIATILYLIPLFNFSVFNTYFLASSINMLVLLLLVRTTGVNFIRKALNKKRAFFYLVLLFFVSQTISLITSIDLFLFLTRWKGLVVLLIFITNSLLIKEQFKTHKFEKVIKQILFTANFINALIALIIIIAPNFFLYYGKKILNLGLLELILLNIERGRIYLASYEEILIPIIMLIAIYSKKNVKKILALLVLLSIIGLSFQTSFRTKLVMTIFAILTSTLIYTKNSMKILIIILVFFFFLPKITLNKIGQNNTFSRILQSKQEDVETIESRLQQYKESFHIFLSSPFLGVGLGNYHHYTNKSHYTIINKNRKIIISDAQLPHNIFFHILAETGLIGLLSYFILLLYFINKDLKNLQKKNKLKFAYILSFWTLFIYSLFNPTLNTSYNVLFWLLRTNIE